MLYLLLPLLLLILLIMAVKGGGEAIFPVFILFFLSLIPVGGSYTNHANDLGVLEAQYYVVGVQEKRLASLKVSLSEITNKTDAKVLLNADSPIASIVDQISEAEKGLADAEVVKANAEVSIAKRKLGLFSFITKMF